MLFRVVENYNNGAVWISVSMADEISYEKSPNIQAEVIHYFNSDKKLSEIKQLLNECETMVCVENKLDKAGIAFVPMEKKNNNESN